MMESLISLWWSVNQFINIPHCKNCTNIFQKTAQGVTILLYHPVPIDSKICYFLALRLFMRYFRVVIRFATDQQEAFFSIFGGNFGQSTIQNYLASLLAVATHTIQELLYAVYIKSIQQVWSIVTYTLTMVYFLISNHQCWCKSRY